MRASPTLPSQLSHIRFSTTPFRRASLGPSIDCAKALPTRQVSSRNFSIHRPRYQIPGNSNVRSRGNTFQPKHFYSPRYSSVLSGLTLGLLCAVGAGLGLGVTLYYTIPSSSAGSTSPKTLEIRSKDTDDMSPELLPGRPGNLTAEQEEKLRQLWQLIFQVCGVGLEKAGEEPSKLEKTSTGDTKNPKKSRMGFLRRSKKDSDDSAPEAKPTGAPLLSGNHGEEDKHGQVKHFYDTLTSQSPEFIRDTIWSMVKHDHPDALALRFLRARKWDVEKALIMFISTINWRATEIKVDDDIMRNGEGAAVEAEKGADGPAKILGRDFLAQMRMGKSYLHGSDKLGRPICVIKVRLHKAGEQVEESLERYTVFLIETARMMLHPPIDTATILFDMTGFSMANMDYTPVKFMIKCFEANYPESLGTVLIHNAPWLFQGIWRVVKGWLDPVVASKINFTNNSRDLEAFIDRSKLPKDLDGDEDWSYKYVEPVPGENDVMKDTVTRDRLLAEREELYKAYEHATIEWIQHPDAAEIKAKRNEIAAKLRDEYWVLDPYIRARSLYDRIGVLKKGGKVDFYPTAEAETVVEEKVGAGAGVPVTAAVPVVAAADDID